MRRYDYSSLKNGSLPADILNYAAAISELKGGNVSRKKEHTKVFESLERVAKVRSVKSSNSIEGIITADSRITALMEGKTEPRNHSEEEILGYRDSLALIHKNYSGMSFDETDVLALHAVLFRHTAEGGGFYKSENNLITETDENGRRTVRFRPVAAAETPEAMEQLFLAYSEASQSGIHPLLLIPRVILDFLCIHPFRDGNGRMSRLLSLLLLYKAGFDVGKYISFEEQIDLNKDLYYTALEESSALWHEGKENPFPFIKNFLFTLLSCYRELDRRFAIIEDAGGKKPKRVEALLSGSLIPLSKAEIADILPDASVTTIEQALGELLKSGKIEKLGLGRGTRYIRRNVNT